MSWIPPIEAFRMLLVRMLSRAWKEPMAFANAITIADAITSDEWFANAWQHGVTAEVRLTAERARQGLCGFVNEGAIALRGELHNRVPPIDIVETECMYGMLDVFGATLTVHSRVYRHILLNVDDFLSCLDNFEKRIGLAAQVPPQTTSVESSETEISPKGEIPAAPPDQQHNYRYPSDAALIEEGRKLIAAGKSKRQTARELAPGAKGGSIEQREERLRKLF